MMCTAHLQLGPDGYIYVAKGSILINWMLLKILMAWGQPAIIWLMGVTVASGDFTHTCEVGLSRLYRKLPGARFPEQALATKDCNGANDIQFRRFNFNGACYHSLELWRYRFRGHVDNSSDVTCRFA